MRRLLLLPLLLPLLAACGPVGGPSGLQPRSTLARILSRGEVVVGLEAEFPPFEYVKDGEIVGFDVDLARLVAKELDVELRIEDLGWTALSPALESGKIDVIISGMTATLDRAKGVAFTDPYFETGLCLLLHRGTTDDVRSVEDLDDPRYRIVVKTGTTGEQAAGRFLPKARIYSLPKEMICALEVSQGKAHAFVYDRFAVIENQRRYPDTTRAILEPFTYEPYAMGIRRGDFDWWNWLNQFLGQIEKDGRYEEIRRRYFGEGAEGD